MRVCSYERAGSGFSDIGPLPRDADAIASDLHTLLARAGIRGPLILVGHSDGELYARVYADRYLDDVAGLVFVEPALERQDERRAEASAPAYAQGTIKKKRSTGLVRSRKRSIAYDHTPTCTTCAPLSRIAIFQQLSKP